MMQHTRFINAIETAEKVFVWVELSVKRAAYLQVSKTALYEYLYAVISGDGIVHDLTYVSLNDEWYAFTENNELYIGAPPED